VNKKGYIGVHKIQETKKERKKIARSLYQNIEEEALK
jgi:hypothetical protein